jgi:hypothetical protein
MAQAESKPTPLASFVDGEAVGLGVQYDCFVAGDISLDGAAKFPTLPSRPA